MDPLKLGNWQVNVAKIALFLSVSRSMHVMKWVILHAIMQCLVCSDLCRMFWIATLLEEVS